MDRPQQPNDSSVRLLLVSTQTTMVTGDSLGTKVSEVASMFFSSWRTETWGE